MSDVVDALCQRYPTLRDLLPAIRVALDGEFVDPSASLFDGAELVLIPPVSGGSGDVVSRIALTESPLTPDRLNGLVDMLQTPQHGAVATFIGVVRDHSEGRRTERLFYEAYASMALHVMETIVTEVEAAHENLSVAVHHRLGTLEVGEWAVIVVVTSGHRAEAFAACRDVIDRLKREVPIWKQEQGPDGAVWA